jgi:DNA-binding NtrC family response regulator
MTDKVRIVLAEDDDDQAALFAQVLTMAGYDVAVAATGADALHQLAAVPARLLVTDWDMPGMKGDALIVAAKARYPALKTILYSNHAHVADGCAASGADGCIRKSEGIVRLRELVKSLIA